MRRAVIAVLAVAAFAASVVSSAVSAGAATTAGGDEAELLRLTNEARVANGLAPMADDRLAAEVARAWSHVMADSATLRHNPDLVADVEAHVTREWARLGENVGRGPDARRLHDAFMASAPHRANVLGDFNRVGVGAARDANGQLWVTLVFLKGPPITWSPFATPEAFAEQQYRDFLGRTGDPGGVAHWAGMLRDGRSNGPAVAESFVRSPEFGQLLAPVVRLYFGAFNRIPDQPGLQSWLDARRRGTSLAAIADAFASSAEFRTRYDRYDNRGFVDALYRTVFGRPADRAGLDHWAGGLDAGRYSRGGVLLGVTGADEFVWRSHAEVSVTIAYVGLLRRSPDANGFNAAVGALDNGRPYVELLSMIIGSDEYRRRFA